MVRTNSAYSALSPKDDGTIYFLYDTHAIYKGTNLVEEGTTASNITGNAATATKLQNTRTFWGQNFDGSANVSGALTGVTDITASGAISAANLTLTNRVTAYDAVFNSASPIALFGIGSGTYTQCTIYCAPATNGFTVQSPLLTDSAGGTLSDIVFTWRGGYASKGGLKIGGSSKVIESTQYFGLSIGGYTSMTPAAPVHIVGETLAKGGNGYYVSEMYGVSGGLMTRYAQGTKSSPTAVGSGNTLALWDVGGYNGTSLVGGKASITFSATQAWTAVGNGSQITLSTTANGATSSRAVLTLGQDGNITANIGSMTATSFYQSSLRAIKKDIKQFNESAIDLLNKVNVKSFKYKNNDKESHIGFIADDTHELLSGKNHDHSDHGNAIGLLIKAVQELTQRNNELQKKLDELC
jgi:prefoldin subunit 5